MMENLVEAVHETRKLTIVLGEAAEPVAFGYVGNKLDPAAVVIEWSRQTGPAKSEAWQLKWVAVHGVQITAGGLPGTVERFTEWKSGRSNWRLWPVWITSLVEQHDPNRSAR